MDTIGRVYPKVDFADYNKPLITYTKEGGVILAMDNDRHMGYAVLKTDASYQTNCDSSIILHKSSFGEFSNADIRMYTPTGSDLYSLDFWQITPPLKTFCCADSVVPLSVFESRNSWKLSGTGSPGGGGSGGGDGGTGNTLIPHIAMFFRVSAPPAYQEGLNIEKENEPSKITIYPNPTTGLVYINYKPNYVSDIEIIDVSGRNITGIKNKTGSNESKLDLSLLPQGVYFVKMQTQDGYKLFKVILQKQ